MIFELKIGFRLVVDFCEEFSILPAILESYRSLPSSCVSEGLQVLRNQTPDVSSHRTIQSFDHHIQTHPKQPKHQNTPSHQQLPFGQEHLELRANSEQMPVL